MFNMYNPIYSYFVMQISIPPNSYTSSSAQLSCLSEDLSNFINTYIIQHNVREFNFRLIGPVTQNDMGQVEPPTQIIEQGIAAINKFYDDLNPPGINPRFNIVTASTQEEIRILLATIKALDPNKNVNTFLINNSSGSDSNNHKQPSKP